ncbi:hypothetical protein Tco_0926134 [Tanacetum coccineum]|uniref:Uncharacterized protein n=1 Tax=Tanacetum coccineum TaxID=301880 RepID=A0ABQ5D8W7_9ASTR
MQAARDRQKSYADLKLIDGFLPSGWGYVFKKRLERLPYKLEHPESEQFVEEPVEIIDREVKRLKRSRIPLVKGKTEADIQAVATLGGSSTSKNQRSLREESPREEANLFMYTDGARGGVLGVGMGLQTMTHSSRESLTSRSWGGGVTGQGARVVFKGLVSGEVYKH